MNILILTAHPSDKSFNRALAQEIHAALQHDHTVRLRDLYQDPFQPVRTLQDMDPAQDAPDVTHEQTLIRWADLLVPIYPVWWTGMPALLKGYFDRVFTPGFAYDHHEGRKRSLLHGKQAMLFSTTGATKTAYDEEHMFTAMNMTVDHGILEYCGIHVLGHHYYAGMAATSFEDRQGMLQDARTQIRSALHPTRPPTGDNRVPFH